MTRLESLITELGLSMPAAAVAPGSREGVGITAIDMDLPVESAIGDGAALSLSLPRGRLATGFDPHHGRLRVRFTRGSP